MRVLDALAYRGRSTHNGLHDLLERHLYHVLGELAPGLVVDVPGEGHCGIERLLGAHHLPEAGGLEDELYEVEKPDHNMLEQFGVAYQEKRMNTFLLPYLHLATCGILSLLSFMMQAIGLHATKAAVENARLARALHPAPSAAARFRLALQLTTKKWPQARPLVQSWMLHV